MNQVVVASHNVKKAGEMRTILGARFPEIEWLTLYDFEGAPEPEETGTTYEENVAIKARSAFEFTGKWCVADDAGLEIDALPGELGVYSKRFAGEETPFDHKMQIILDRLAGVPVESRGCRFRCLVALIGPGHDLELFEGRCEGVVATERSGSGGFGYDPIFWLPQFGCTMADLTPEQKNQISHRGQVLGKLGDRMEQILALSTQNR